MSGCHQHEDHDYFDIRDAIVNNDYNTFVTMCKNGPPVEKKNENHGMCRCRCVHVNKEKSMLMIAAKYNRINFMDEIWKYEKYVDEPVKYAIENGAVEVLEWFCNKTDEALQKGNRLIDLAIVNQQIKIVSFLHKKGLVISDKAILQSISKNENVELVAFLCGELKMKIPDQALMYMFKYNYYDSIEWLKKNGTTFSENVINEARKWGHSKIISLFEQPIIAQQQQPRNMSENELLRFELAKTRRELAILKQYLRQQLNNSADLTIC